MTGPLLARRVARVLSRDLLEDAAAPNDRDLTVAAMQRALRARRTRRKQARWLGGVAAAAAIALASLAAFQRHVPGAVANATAPAPAAEIVAEDVSGGVLMLSDGHTSPLFDGKAIGTGDHVLALLDGHATIALVTGTRLSVAGGGDLALLSGGPTHIFALGAGSVRADVAKQHPGERFVIRTADAEVEVRGTSFRVATAPPDPACGSGTTTRVSVFEGVVTVRVGTVETAVHPGESWPRDCGGPPSTSPAVPASVGALSAAARTSPAPVPSSAARPAASPSELAAQNDMFDAAMLAKRRGDLRGAVASFDQLLSRYPGCPFAESAEAERMKLLAETDRVRAVVVARDYLRRYPGGFAHGDAEALLH
jgi:ferric-dicitrate binding protein FerR (iron transport regulator)